MGFDRVFILSAIVAIVNADVVANNSAVLSESVAEVDKSADAFNGVYTECFLYLSYSCLQKKTLVYLKALNNLSEVSVVGDYVKFVKIPTVDVEVNTIDEDDIRSNSEGLSLDIDNAVNRFFDSHILRFKALGKDIAMSHTVDEFVGRKKRKGGGGGGGGHDDGKKKMMMMAMMCMKMKMMMMIPAMMGMMGMMSFKGMMFSMMTFMMSKMMLLMKILEKKGGGGGGSGGGGGGDGWAAGGGGGGAWMPAGAQDYGGGGGGGYDANGQWQSRSIFEQESPENAPTISYVTPLVRYNNNANGKKPYLLVKNLNDEVIKANVKSRDKRGVLDALQTNNFEETMEEFKIKDPVISRIRNLNKIKANGKWAIIEAFSNTLQSYPKTDTELAAGDQTTKVLTKPPSLVNLKTENMKTNEKSRKKRGIIDVLQNTYLYWINRVLGARYKNKLNPPKYKIVNGVKYVYYPLRYIQKAKKPKALNNDVKEENKTVITAEDFNKGEIIEGPVESRMHKKKFMKMKDSVNETVDDNPWE